MQKLNKAQIARLAKGENPDAVLRKCEWDRADIVQALAKKVLQHYKPDSK